MDKLNKTSLLIDFYGDLLTDKQKSVMILHYEQDMSFGEISENLNISRQAVYDTLKRSEKLLDNYESKLGLVEKFEAQKAKLNELKRIIINSNMEDKPKALKIIDDLLEIY